MRRIALAALLSLAIAPAALAQPASAPKQCTDSAGRAVVCPQQDSRSEVQVEAPLRKPPPEPPTNLKNPGLAFPPMATAQCRDGSFYRGTQPGVACALHAGVQMWMH
jgi:hypothetical protein